jgi:hypothetical protein
MKKISMGDHVVELVAHSTKQPAWPDSIIVLLSGR